MTRRLAGVVTAVLAVTLVAVTQQPAVAAPAYLSIVIARASSQEADASCTPYANTVKIADVARGLRQRGVGTVVATVVTDYADAAETGTCLPWYSSDRVRQGQSTGAGWTQLDALRRNYGWQIVSHSKTYADLTQVTDDATRQTETCGTLATLEGHGHTNAWGMFAYPDDQLDAPTEAAVDGCFAYGRKYGTPNNTRTSTAAFPHLLRTASVNGGRCNNAKLACSNLPVVNNRRYALPGALAAQMRPAAGVYSLVQFYRFVTGKRAAETGPVWDCTATDANNHYTSAPELYCLNDFWKAVAGRSSKAVLTHPAAVANLWGRVPGVT